MIEREQDGCLKGHLREREKGLGILFPRLTPLIGEMSVPQFLLPSCHLPNDNLSHAYPSQRIETV